MRQRYIDWNPHGATQAMILKANEVISEMRAQGYTLTLRQLYYQFVARGWLANKQQNYKRLGDILNKSRLAGLIDWDSIEDRIRVMRERAHWEHPNDVIKSAAHSWGMDLWKGQSYRPEVWIEKDALASVAERVCVKWDVPLLVCRGYTSQSAMKEAADRFVDWLNGRAAVPANSDSGRAAEEGRAPAQPIVFYLGDHDPSGIQMAHDINGRLRMFTGQNNILRRIALTMKQVEQFNPPPNPAKETDSRYKQYVDEFGEECWELDALHPKFIAQTIEKAIKSVVELEQWKARQALQEAHRSDIQNAADHWPKVATFVKGLVAEEDETQEESNS